jgi:hypothetical protein
MALGAPLAWALIDHRMAEQQLAQPGEDIEPDMSLSNVELLCYQRAALE